VKALGADQVIDYQQTGISELGRHYHAVIDMAGVVALSQWRSVLIDKGRYVQVGAPYQQGLFGPLKNTLQVAWQGIRCSRCEWTSVNAKRVYSDRLWLAEKAQSGQLVTHIGHCFPLSDIQEAMRVIESGHTGGKVIISVNTDE
jgi:NADPH:quinone reductase-like Zn-dependent oxidoreductase